MERNLNVLTEPAIAAWQHRKGFWSTDCPEHPERYDAGQLANLARCEDIVGPLMVKTLDDVTRKHIRKIVFGDTLPPPHESTDYTREVAEQIRAQVSRHAFVSIPAFVAEVYTGLLAGRQYSEEIMNRYYGSFGPRLDDNAIESSPAK